MNLAVWVLFIFWVGQSFFLFVVYSIGCIVVWIFVIVFRWLVVVFMVMLFFACCCRRHLCCFCFWFWPCFFIVCCVFFGICFGIVVLASVEVVSRKLTQMWEITSE